MNYFEWLVKSTKTRFWHDSGDPYEIEEAIKLGATGVTTNPVLAYEALKGRPEFWNDKIKEIGDELEPGERAEALLKLVTCNAANAVRHIFEESCGKDGYALAQLNPRLAGNSSEMLKEALRFSKWAPNIAIKLPATASGIELAEVLAEQGIPQCITVNTTVAQAIAAAEAYERGSAKAKKKALCIVVQQVGRLDDYLRDIASDMKLSVSEEAINMSGIAVAKRTYEIFRNRGYSSVIMPAGFRGPHHLTELSGGNFIYTVSPRVSRMVLSEEPEKCEKYLSDVDETIIDELMSIPEFVKAYETDGLKPSEFISFGLTQKLLTQFYESGWAPLETYMSNKKSLRWI